jgi:glycerophosphoryl diester phosphodiesterase
MRWLGLVAVGAMLPALGCGSSDACVDGVCTGNAPRDKVWQRIDELAPAAAIGHRGTGPTREGHRFSENSISSFLAAIDEGADGIELDVEITEDGQLIVMHDDTLDRTTDCTGCVSETSFEQARACRLLDGGGNPTDEAPPTLAEVYAAIGGNALINVELKVFEPPCATASTDPEALVTAVLAEVARIGGENRTIFSSFNELAVQLIKTRQPGYYSALISNGPEDALVDTALRLGQDAIHPFITVSAQTVQSAREQGLQVGIWTINTAPSMQAAIDKGATAILTDQAAVLVELLGR